MSTQDLLTQIDAAISALLTGGAESYAIGNRSVTKLDLATLMDERRKLQQQLSRENGGTFRLAKLGRRR